MKLADPLSLDPSKAICHTALTAKNSKYLLFAIRPATTKTVKKILMTQYTKIFPCYYKTTGASINFDAKEIVKKMLDSRFLKQRLHNRPLRFGAKSNSSLEAFKSKDVLGCTVQVTSCSEISGIELHELNESQHPLRQLVDSYTFTKQPEKHHFNLSDGWSWNYLVIQMNIAPTIDSSVPIALTTELSHLLKVAIQLQYGTEYFLFFGSRSIPDNCLAFLDGNGQKEWSFHQSIEHTFPADLDDFDPPLFKKLCRELADNWSGNIWPFHRFLKAIPHQRRLDCDSLLDMIFALEAMFPQGANSQFIRTYCGCLEDSIKSSKRTRLILKEAFDLRNEIVHAGKWFDADSKLILYVKAIVSKALYQGLKNASANFGKPTLNEETLTNLVFKAK